MVSAASAAAKYVSSVSLVADTFRCSPDLGKSRLAESARRSLVIWNFGLQQNSSSVRDSDIPSHTQLTSGDDNFISDPSHSTAQREPSGATSALGVQRWSDSDSHRANPPDSPQSNPNSGHAAVDAEPEVKCSQDLVPDTQSPAGSQVDLEELTGLTQVPATKQAEVKQSELEESQF